MKTAGWCGGWLRLSGGVPAGMLSVRPLVRTVPAAPAPGRVEEALGLVLAHAFPFRAQQQGAVLTYLLEAGPVPAPALVAAARFGVSVRRVRQVVHSARLFARAVPAPVSLLEAVRLVEVGGICTGGDVSAALQQAGLTVDRVPVRALLRIAELFDLPTARTCRVITPGGGLPVGGIDTTVVVPLGEQQPLAVYLDRLHLATRHQIAVAVTPDALGGDAAGLRCSTEEALAVVVAGDARFRVHRSTAEPAPRRRRSRPAQYWWVWRAREQDRENRGVSVRLVRRLLAVRPRTAEQLHEALVAALGNLPPSQRYDATVPPVAVLAAWLADVAGQGSGLARRAGGWSWDVPMPRVDAALVAGVWGHDGAVDSDVLLGILTGQGYSRAAARALLSVSPVLQRVAPREYALR